MKLNQNKKVMIPALVILLMTMSASLIAAQKYFPRKWNARKVELSFNHYYDWKEVEEALRKLEKAYPKFLKLRSIGKSYQGREMWYMTINNPDTGSEMQKCAMYMDANIHGNEVQGGEIGIYTIWYLMENYNTNDTIRKLVDERVFYIFPSVNPDGRDLWLHSGDSARTGQAPMDSDSDGLYDEDGAEDLDGDGEVGSMFIKVEPGKGTHRLSDIGDRLVPIHNSGGMILRGPGAQLHGEYPRADLIVYDEIGQKGERIIEGYDYIIIWDDLYTVWGGFVDFTHDMLGIFSFSNELWTSRADLDNDGDITQEEREFFEKYIDMDNTAISMHQIDHPQLGKVTIDRDTTKLSGRVPPSWLLEELCHRNMAFCLLHADEMPLPIIKDVSAEKIASGFYRLKVSLYNERLMPTMSAAAVANMVQPPDTLSIDGNIKVLAAGQAAGTGMPAGVPSQFRRFFRGRGAADSDVTFIDQKDLKNLKLTNGISGRSEVEYHFLVEGKGNVTVKLDCAKGGKHTKMIVLK